jgi:hypothetical protein
MNLVLSAYTLILVGLVGVYGMSGSNLVFSFNSIAHHNDDEKSRPSYPPSENMETLPDTTLVEIIKSFKNSSGFYKINGTLENQGAIILSDIKVIKYYKVPSVNDTTLVCYEQDIVNCQYKSIDNTLPVKRFFLTMPPSPPETSINPN